MNVHIETYPSKILRQTCEDIDIKEEQMFAMNICNKMAKVIKDFEALGLAANQLGYNKRIIGIHKRGVDEPKFMLNPVISEKKGVFIGDEACLSFPGVLVKVKRSAVITVKYFSLESDKEIEEKLMGEEAIIIQHEVDHLDGKTLVNSASGALREKVMRQLKVGKRKFAKAMKQQARLRKLGDKLKMIDDEAGRQLAKSALSDNNISIPEVV